MVKSVAAVGGQAGDEGKGKVVGHNVREGLRRAIRSGLVNEVDISNLVIRFQGGNNAGHIQVIDGVKYATHHLPSGVLIAERVGDQIYRPFSLMGEDMCDNPRDLLKEIEGLRSQGIEITPEQLGIASNAHVTLDYHIKDDRKYSSARDGTHTSTGKGIKQNATDKMSRVGLRFVEFLDPVTMLEVMKEHHADQIRDLGYRSIEEFVASYDPERDALKDFIVLQADIFRRNKGGYATFEGGQGFLIDVNKGLYPGSTSSSTVSPSQRVDAKIGIVKLYTSSVGGNRPHVPKITDPELEEVLRQEFLEFGTTTGNARDIGWLDAVAVAHAADDAEFDYLAVTCGDRLEFLHTLGQPVGMVTGYKIDGKEFNRWDTSFHNRRTLHRAVPLIEEFEPWSSYLDANGELTPNARRFTDRLEELTGKEIILHSTGRGIDDVKVIKDILD